MLKSPMLSYSIQTQKPFSLSLSDQDPWPSQSPSLFRLRPNHHLHGHGFQISSFLISSSLLTQTLVSLSLSLSLSRLIDRSKPSTIAVWCLDLKTINQTQKGPIAVHGCGGQRWRIKAWGASAWVPHGETKVEDRMVVIGLKIGEGLKLMDVDVVGLKILDHWFWV